MFDYLSRASFWLRLRLLHSLLYWPMSYLLTYLLDVLTYLLTYLPELESIRQAYGSLTRSCGIWGTLPIAALAVIPRVDKCLVY